jgi:aspartyl-tRNA(Asn)/glutamyl-tRNA(Gln) amidotransferase subunit A
MEFASAVPDASKPFPIPRNPWDMNTWPGGSSSGTGSGVAAGMFLGGLGTDTGGSIRIPAAFCGITGLMATFGRVPKSGCVPLGYSLDHIGPMARSARDCAAMLNALAGYDASDAGAAQEPVPDYLATLTGDLTGVRVGVDTLARTMNADADPGILPAIESTVAMLAARGATIVEVELPYYDEAMAAIWVLCVGEAAAYHMPDAQSRLADYFAGNAMQLASVGYFSGADYVQAQRVRRVIHKAITALYDQVDLIVTPTSSVGAISHDVLGSSLKDWFDRFQTGYWDITGNPVIAMPAGFTAGGLPLSVQIAGRPFDEAGVLNAAEAYQQQTDWHLAVPPLVTRAMA